MQPLPIIEHLTLLILIFALNYLLWLCHQDEQEQLKKKDKEKKSPGNGDPNLPPIARPASQVCSCPSSRSGER